jgi:very-short-patch-repair endonuclease
MDRLTDIVIKNQDKSYLFSYYLKLLAPGVDALVPEYRFHPVRRWRFDHANVELKVAIEIDGGIYLTGGGRHNTDKDRHNTDKDRHNTDKDRDKINQAVSLGWRVLRFSTQQIKNDPKNCIDLYLKTIGAIE